MINEGFCDSVICFDPKYIKEKIEDDNEKKLHFVNKLDKTSYKLILMMDVLEHVADDVAFLKEYTDKIEVFCLTVFCLCRKE